MKKIFITDYFNESKIEKNIFGKSFQIICLNSKNENDFPNIISDADGLLVWHSNISEKTLIKLKHCKAIVRYGVGYDNIDIKCAKKHNIICMNTPDYGTDEVADTAAAMILSLTRKIQFYNNTSKNYKKGWQENVLKDNIDDPIRRTDNYTLGILGLGRIGSALALRLKNFGFNIGYFDPYLPLGYEKVIGIKKFKSLNELVKKSDIISINSLLTPETESLVNKKFISKMRNRSFLVNTARGAIINKLDDIYYGLKSGKLSGVGLDVLPEEPPRKNEKLIKSWLNKNDSINKKIIINPHAGYYSSKSVIEMRVKASENLKAVILHNKIVNKIN